jgi:aldehyde:ferredoxin oxidoreductase
LNEERRVIMDYILRIDMGKREVMRESVPEEYRFMGGRGLNAMILSKEVDPLCHPLGSKNKLIFSPGLLAGTMAPSFGRLSVGAKSPLTGGIKEANAGGTAAQKLDRLGIKSIIVENKAQDGTWIVRISREGCEIIRGDRFKKMRNYDLVKNLMGEFGDNISIISIGPCGEMRMRASTVAVTDQDGRPSRHAARGGLGAVMGSKGLKAIVIDDSGTSRVEIKDRDAFQKSINGLVDTIKQDKGSPRLNSSFGTPGVISFVNTIGSMPTMNYRRGSFEEAKNIMGETIKEINERRGGTMHGCMPGCIIQCSIVFFGEDGSPITSAFEYETIAMMGSNLGIGNPDAIARIDRFCDEIGIDTIETGSAIAQAMEAGIIEVGDANGVLKALEEIENGTPLGRILGQGTVMVAHAYGLDRVPAVLGQAIPAHDPRVCKPVGVTYATSPMGADHTAGIDYRDSLSKEGQVRKSRDAQILMATMDSIGYCMLAMPTKSPTILPFWAELINARYGSNLTVEDLISIGKKTIKMEIEFNRRTGIDFLHDIVPEFIKNEPLPPQNAVFDIAREEIESIWKDL